MYAWLTSTMSVPSWIEENNRSSELTHRLFRYRLSSCRLLSRCQLSCSQSFSLLDSFLDCWYASCNRQPCASRSLYCNAVVATTPKLCRRPANPSATRRLCVGHTLKQHVGTRSSPCSYEKMCVATILWAVSFQGVRVTPLQPTDIPPILQRGASQDMR